MAVDESILESVIEENQPTTLRLYDWFPYALSLGHSQHFSDIDQPRLQVKGWDLVRRPTGGRAILHADELTYSISSNAENPILKGSVIESYRIISRALLSALENIGLNANSKLKNQDDSLLSKDPICFQFPSDYEITINDKKIVGSAQARKKNGILQHGSIPLYGDITRIISVLNFENEQKMTIAKNSLFQKASTIKDTLGKFISWSQMAHAVILGFKNSFDVDFFQTQLTKQELNRAKVLFFMKYANNSWTLRI